MSAPDPIDTGRLRAVLAEREPAAARASFAVRVVRAPGRVNLIGEHTDYNEGFVMPVAINRGTSVAIAPRDDRVLQVRSSSFADAVEIDLDRIAPGPTGHWSDAVRGVAAVLEEQRARLRGGDLLIQTDLPLGAGLSSSAALEVSVGYALLDVSNAALRPAGTPAPPLGGPAGTPASPLPGPAGIATSPLPGPADTSIPVHARPSDAPDAPVGPASLPASAIDLTALALACQRAEHDFVGTRCGVMDQFIVCHGRAGYALRLDTRDLGEDWLPLPADISVVVCNTMVRHELATSAYNSRRADCETGVAILQRCLPAVRALRDVTMDDLEAARGDLSEQVYRRCRHVISENARVTSAARALHQNRLDAFGRLMAASHRSLRDDYEVSCRELDVMVDLAARLRGVLGARMTGGGFGGCTVNLVRAEYTPAFQQEIGWGYRSVTGILPEIYVLAAAGGVAEQVVR